VRPVANLLAKCKFLCSSSRALASAALLYTVFPCRAHVLHCMAHNAARTAFSRPALCALLCAALCALCAQSNIHQPSAWARRRHAAVSLSLKAPRSSGSLWAGPPLSVTSRGGPEEANNWLLVCLGRRRNQFVSAQIRPPTWPASRQPQPGHLSVSRPDLRLAVWPAPKPLGWPDILHLLQPILCTFLLRRTDKHRANTVPTAPTVPLDSAWPRRLILLEPLA